MTNGELTYKYNGKKYRRYKACENAPEACFNCPYPDCINNCMAKQEEQEFVLKAIGSRHPIKYRKRRKCNESL